MRNAKGLPMTIDVSTLLGYNGSQCTAEGLEEACW